MRVLAPCAGRVLPLAQVPDPVFAGGMVGPGVAIDPVSGPTTVLAPVAGRVLKVHPHAFVVLAETGAGVLVHLGIDTVRLEGEGFEVLAVEGSSVEAGDPMVRWDPADVGARGLSAVVPVVVMEAPEGSVSGTVDTDVTAGDLLLTVG